MSVTWHQVGQHSVFDARLATPAGLPVARINRACCGHCWRWAAWGPAWNDARESNGHANTLEGAKKAAQAWLSALTLA